MNARANCVLPAELRASPKTKAVGRRAVADCARDRYEKEPSGISGEDNQYLMR